MTFVTFISSDNRVLLYYKHNQSHAYSDPALSVSTAKVVDPAQSVLVVDGLVDCDDEGEGGGQLNPSAQLLVAPVEAAQPLSQVPSACLLQSVLQQLGLIGLIP